MYNLDNIIKIEDIDFENFSLNEKSYGNILSDDVSFKNFIDAKPLSIMFDEVNRFIRDYDGTKYLVLFGAKKDDATFDRIKYFKRLKSSITYVDFFNYSNTTIDSDDDLSLKKHWLYITFSYSLSQFFKKITASITIRCSYQPAKK